MLARKLHFAPPPFTFVPPRDWLPRLRVLVEAYPHDDLTSTEALCCRVVDDFPAGIVLHRLFYWLPKGRRADGAIWKSDREWLAELTLSRAQMKRIRRRLLPVVDSWVERAQGAPTYHYQLRLDELVGGIAAVLSRPTVEIKLTLLDKVEKRFSAESQNDFRQSRKSLTNQPQLNFMDERLKIFHPYLKRFAGFTPEVSAKLEEQCARLGEDKTREVLARCDASAGRSWQYVLRALENVSIQVYAAPLFNPPSAPAELIISDEMRAAWAASDEGSAWSMRLELARNPTPVGTTHVSSAETEPTGEWADAWRKAHSQLEVQLDRASFDTWLRSARFLEYADGTFQIGVPNTYAREMLQHRLYRDVRRVLSDVIGSRVELCFEVHKPEQQPVGDDELPAFRLLALQEEATAAEMTFYRRHWLGFDAEAQIAYAVPANAQMPAYKGGY